eukprot:jgi/Tetstr1/464952/TSEL_009686.t1
MDDVVESKVEDADVEEELHAASDEAGAHATAGVTSLQCGGAKAAPAESPGSGKSSGAPLSQMAGRGGQCCLICLHEINKQDAPLDPDAPCIKCEGHLRPPVAILGYMDYAANARCTRSEVGFFTPGTLRFFLHFDGGVNIPAGERGFENARQKPSGDMHLAGLPITLLHEVITVGVGMRQGELHKLAIRLSTFAITAARGDDGKVTLRTSAMHPSDLEADTTDNNRWPHAPLYKRYLTYNELRAGRIMRRNKKCMVPAFKDLLLEGSKSRGAKAAIESIGCYTERLPQPGCHVGMEPFMHPKLTLVNCGYRGHTAYGREQAARRAREEEMEALKRELSLLKYKYKFETAYRMVRAPGRLEIYTRNMKLCR